METEFNLSEVLHTDGKVVDVFWVKEFIRLLKMKRKEDFEIPEWIIKRINKLAGEDLK